LVSLDGVNDAASGGGPPEAGPIPPAVKSRIVVG
jgi:hypothetical protein